MAPAPATAPPQVVEDIRAQLDLPDLNVISTGTYRSNLKYEVIGVDDDDAKLRQLVPLVAESEGIGIVYTSTVKHAETVSDFLKAHGIPAEKYHGRMRARDGSAVADLASLYGPRIQQLAFRYLKNWEDAEEVAQDVLLKVYSNIDAFRGDAALSSWI